MGAGYRVAWPDDRVYSDHATGVNDPVSSIGRQVVYEWNIADNHYAVSGDLKALLEDPCSSFIDRAAHQGGLADGGAVPLSMPGLMDDVQHMRQEAILLADGSDPMFSLAYPACSDARETWPRGWIEERGMRVFNADGTLNRVMGVLRPLSTFVDAPARGGAPGLHHDGLTGLLDRCGFRESLRLRMQADNEEARFSYLLVAIDDLSVINETYGFSVADEIIASLGTLLAGLSRRQDMVGRVSGTKFSVVLDQCNVDGLSDIAARLVDQIQAMPFVTSSGTFNVTVSLGGVCPDQIGTTVDGLMAQGEVALAQARAEGGNGFSLFTPCAEREAQRHRTAVLADKIISGLNSDRLTLAYQPIVDCRTGEIVQWECLARLLDTDGEAIPAGLFIPVAEDLGLIRRIDLRVLTLALENLARFPELRLSVNVSGSGTVERAWLDRYIAAIEEAGPVAERLTIEITEYAQIEDVERSAHFVSRLRALGCTLAIDDFGAGYTSFRNLQRLDVDIVKIDGAFIRNLSQDADNQVFARSLIDLAMKIGLRTVAECVDCDEDVKLLREMGADYLQGFHLGKPVLDPPWRIQNTAQQAASNG